MQQEWAQRNDVALQQNQQLYNSAMQQGILHPSQIAAYQALGASDLQNNLPEKVYHGQRR